MTHGYPRPQLERSDWVSLNGAWEFAIDAEARWRAPDEVDWNRTIEVPFAPETPLSGVGDTSYYNACWYRRTVDTPERAPGQRLRLHFGAVDFRATVWVDGRLAATHEGGYTPFSADVSDSTGPQMTIVVRAEDNPHDLQQPRGKQDWLPEPHGIWYPRTTGIWQTVWLERVPEVSIEAVRWTPSVLDWSIGVEARIAGNTGQNLTLEIRLSVGDATGSSAAGDGGAVLSADSYTVAGEVVERSIGLADPGIDDSRNALLWRPDRPALIDAVLRLRRADGTVVDEVRSYTAMREVSVQGDRFVLNGRPLKLRLALDQGYWVDGGLTAPDDDALRRDVELAKAMGFNGVRKHQKIEDPRYLYWADRLGLLVWEEMPSAYRFTRTAVHRLTSEWTAAIERDYSHPCIVAWVPFNESWGVPDLPSSSEQRHYVQALYHLTRTLDPTRPAIGNDGWEFVAADIVGIHDYERSPETIAERYRSHEIIPHILKRVHPAGRAIALPEHPYADQPIMLTEFGGIAFSDDPEHTWGYTRAQSAEQLAEQYTRLLEAVRGAPIFGGFCYTQFTDTYQESNGLLYMNRQPKFPLEQIAAATRGPEWRRG